MRKIFLGLLSLFVFCPFLFADGLIIESGGWTITLNENSRKLQIQYDDFFELEDVYAEASYNFKGSDEIFTVVSSAYNKVELEEKRVSDDFGSGKRYTFIYSGEEDVILEQSFYFYDDYPYFITDLVLKSVDEEKDIFTNYIVPLTSQSASASFQNDDTNRMIWVPWDNDAWVTYKLYELDKSMISHEVAVVFNGETRFGLVAGAIEHDTWKNGVSIEATDKYRLNKFSCFSGYTSETSRDVLPHGKISGQEVKSAKFLVGCFDDWRLGMDEFGKANAKIVPPLEWESGSPFGWNSWGSMQNYVSYRAALDVANFLKNDLYEHGFHDGSGQTVLSLDAWWNDNISAANMALFAQKCEENNQLAGIYYGPFCDWNGNPEREVEGSNGQYKYKDIWLKVNGKEHTQGGICIDPTHPGTKMAMEYNLNRYKRWGYKYIKVDFQTNGAIEADSYYNENVTTGTQAYNEGMQYMLDLIGDDMYIVLAISPLFPYQYAHGRRTCCDSYSRIDETQYVMNSTSFGWWTNQLYPVNDPDHLVMISHGGNETYPVNRSRATSGLVTGSFIFGDNFSDLVNRGNPAESRERALVIMGNEDINEAVRACDKSFMPIEGYKATESGAENLLMYHTDKYVYVACINYSSSRFLAGNISFERIGMDIENVAEIKELWTAGNIEFTEDGFNYVVPATDSHVYRITKKDGLGIANGNEEKNVSSMKVSQFKHLVVVNSYKLIQHANLYDVNGVLVNSQKLSSYDVEFEITSLPAGVYVLKVDFDDNTSESVKLIFQ